MLKDLPRPRDYRFFSDRIKTLQVFLMIVLAVILVQLVRQSLLHGQKLFDLSENNFLRGEEIDAPRGLITDRHGAVLAYNKSNFSVSISRFRLSRQQLFETLDQLETMLNRDLQHIRGAIPQLRRYQTLRIMDQLPLEDTLPILERQGELPGMVISQSSSRFYPNSTAHSHFLGYTGIVSERQAAALGEKGYTLRSRIGKNGLEGNYESVLRGINGRQLVMRDAVGRTREIRVEQSAEPGKNIETTIDLDLQLKAMELIKDCEYGGVAILMDPQNGEVLALASSPTYDLDNPTSGEQFNRAIQGVYPPGSTFKVFTALAALEGGWDPTVQINCLGSIKLGQWTFRCHRSWGHGKIDMEEALKYSCNIYFYRLAQKYKQGPILEMARRFGLGRPTDIDLPMGEAPGAMTFGNTLYPGELIQVGIGNYGGMKATPVQIITAFCALGNGSVSLPAGKGADGAIGTDAACRLFRPHLMRRILLPEGEVVGRYENKINAIIEIPQSHLRTVLNGMWKVVNEKNGTAFWHIDEPVFERRFPLAWDLIGKTATASRGTKDYPIDDAWFVALAPRERPRIAALVMVERGGSGGDVAAPKVKELLQAYFDKYGLPGQNIPPENNEMPSVDETARSASFENVYIASPSF